MAVYHFTLHAYRSWNPDHPRGYTLRDEGYQRPDPDKAREYDERATFPKIVFDSTIQEILLLGAHDFCARRDCQLHAFGADPSHAHFLMSWRTFKQWQDILARLKNVLSLHLGRTFDRPGGHWFVKEGSRKRVERRDHFDHLVSKYFPDHPGLFWREGMALPEDRYGILESGNER